MEIKQLSLRDKIEIDSLEDRDTILNAIQSEYPDLFSPQQYLHEIKAIVARKANVAIKQLTQSLSGLTGYDSTTFQDGMTNCQVKLLSKLDHLSIAFGILNLEEDRYPGQACEKLLAAEFGVLNANDLLATIRSLSGPFERYLAQVDLILISAQEIQEAIAKIDAICEHLEGYRRKLKNKLAEGEKDEKLSHIKDQIHAEEVKLVHKNQTLLAKKNAFHDLLDFSIQEREFQSESSIANEASCILNNRYQIKIVAVDKGLKEKLNRQKRLRNFTGIALLIVVISSGLLYMRFQNKRVIRDAIHAIKNHPFSSKYLDAEKLHQLDTLDSIEEIREAFKKLCANTDRNAIQTDLLSYFRQAHPIEYDFQLDKEVAEFDLSTKAINMFHQFYGAESSLELKYVAVGDYHAKSIEFKKNKISMPFANICNSRDEFFVSAKISLPLEANLYIEVRYALSIYKKVLLNKGHCR